MLSSSYDRGEPPSLYWNFLSAQINKNTCSYLVCEGASYSSVHEGIPYSVMHSSHWSPKLHPNQQSMKVYSILLISL